MNVGLLEGMDPNKVGWGDYGPAQLNASFGREHYYTPWNRLYVYPMWPPVVIQPFGCNADSKVECKPLGPRAKMQRTTYL